MTRSALIGSEASEHTRRRFLAGSRLDRLGEVLEAGRAGRQVTRSSKALERAPFRERCEHGDRAAAVGDFERFAGLHPTEQLAGPLPQLPNTHLSHVLF